MANNPFRGKPNPIAQQNIEEWGKVKFKPTKFGNGSKKSFNNHQGGKGNNNSINRKFNNRKGNYHKKRDSFKFNQEAKPENATPWNKYKDEIVYKQREEEQAALQANVNSEEAKQALKQREINYRKLLIEQKKQEPTLWEDFTDQEDKNVSNNKKRKHDKEDLNSTAKIIKSKNFKKNVVDLKLKGEKRELIPQEIISNFDSKKLSYQQNDELRKIITKTTALCYGTSLKMTIDDMKRKKAKNYKKHN